MRLSSNLYASLLGCLAIALTSCEGTLMESEKTYNLDVLRPDRDTSFVIQNRKAPTFIEFSFEGELSHSAAIHWSSDPRFESKTEILIPAGKLGQPEARNDYYSQRVYINYKSLNDSTSGKLRIKVKI